MRRVALQSVERLIASPSTSSVGSVQPAAGVSLSQLQQRWVWHPPWVDASRYRVGSVRSVLAKPNWRSPGLGGWPGMISWPPLPAPSPRPSPPTLPRWCAGGTVAAFLSIGAGTRKSGGKLLRAAQGPSTDEHCQAWLAGGRTLTHPPLCLLAQALPPWD